MHHYTELLAHQQPDAAQQQLTELSQIARDVLSQMRQSVSGYKHQGRSAEVTKLLSRLRDAGFQAVFTGEIPQLDPRRETALILALAEDQAMICTALPGKRAGCSTRLYS